METPSMGILAVVFNLIQLVSASPTEYAVEHKFSPESPFSSRGTLKCFPSTKLQCSMYDDTNLLKSFESLTGEGFYYLRVCSEDKKCVQTFIKQCLLLENNYQEVLEINTLPNQEIMSVSLLTPVPTCNGTLAKSLSKRSVSVKTRIEIVDPLTPPEPETSLYVKKVEEEKKKKLKGEGEDNRSFFAKYWMYIVPVLLLVMLNSQGEQGGE